MVQKLERAIGRDSSLVIFPGIRKSQCWTLDFVEGVDNDFPHFNQKKAFTPQKKTFRWQNASYLWIVFPMSRLFIICFPMREFHEFPLSAWFRGGVWFNYSDLQGQIPAGFGRIPFRADNLWPTKVMDMSKNDMDFDVKNRDIVHKVTWYFVYIYRYICIICSLCVQGYIILMLQGHENMKERYVYTNKRVHTICFVCISQSREIHFLRCKACIELPTIIHNHHLTRWARCWTEIGSVKPGAFVCILFLIIFSGPVSSQPAKIRFTTRFMDCS